jgi:hypothetical protein
MLQGGEPDVQTNLIEGSDSRRTQNSVEMKARVWGLERGGHRHSVWTPSQLRRNVHVVDSKNLNENPRVRYPARERSRVDSDLSSRDCIQVEIVSEVKIVSESRTKTCE